MPNGCNIVTRGLRNALQECGYHNRIFQSRDQPSADCKLIQKAKSNMLMGVNAAG